MKHLLSFFSMAMLFVFTACGSEEHEEPPFSGTAKRTMIVYMSGENNLSTFVTRDTTEMIAGSKNLTDCYYIAFIDKAESGQNPSIWKFEKGKSTRVRQYDEDFYSSDPERMHEVLSWIISQYPAKSYALTLWGHAQGWVISNDTIEVAANSNLRRAYGRDSGNDTSSGGKWMNIPTLASVLKHLNARFDYIFCDCCNMANAETAYELRNLTDYLIASPAEIPAQGAPYNTISQSFFADNMTSVCQGIVDGYYQSVGGQLPLAVIKMSEMEQLANATRVILQTMAPTKEKELDLNGLMYYDGERKNLLRSLYDMNDFLLQNAPANDYGQWKQALDKAVIYKKNADGWVSNGHVNFNDFTSTDEKYGGMSMYIPRTFYDLYAYSDNYNSTYNKMQWYWTVGWNSYGW